MAEQKKLHSPLELLGEAWDIFSKRWTTLLAIELLTAVGLIVSVLVLLIPVGLFFHFAQHTALPFQQVLIGIYILSAFLLVLYLLSWGQVALLQAVISHTKKMTIREAFTVSRGTVWDFLWLTLFSGLIILGGTGLFIIPGIVLAVLFSIARFLFFEKKRSATEILHLSISYSKPFFWGILGRIAAFSVFSIVLQLAASKMLYGGHIVSFVLAPISVLYSYVLYRDIVRVRDEKVIEQKGKYSLVFGILLVLGIIFAIIGISVPFIAVRTVLHNNATRLHLSPGIHITPPQQSQNAS